MKTQSFRRGLALRLALVVLLPIGALSACAGPRLEVAGAPSQPSVTLTEAEIGLTVRPHAWTGYPSDLSQYYTPVKVLIENNRPGEIQVRYRDFLAVNNARNQYRAVDPAEVARALYGSRGPLRPRLYAFSDPWWSYPYPYWHPYYYPFYSPFYPYPYLPDYPFGFPRSPAYDVLTRALREGPVLPGARVSGFLYLQMVSHTAQLLTLSWTPVDADGKPLATFRTEFRVVP